ncbi:hypothetical protein GCM10011531_15960 [Aquaticitalea lipolytica]|uniref:DUF5916 domain-containing protein n=2 Tax=Aquaticitalea lipolytica TaxID=1247562 RepID=A0A8J2XIX9_9FLAO|nr:hypothetical protein GCM10011531_15960 [Aquaticitalea lipolytica]
MLCLSSILAQEKKTLQISRTDNPPKIDGVLDDAAWENAMEAKDFTQFRPTMGVAEKDFQKTVVKMTYDNDAIYIAAYLYDKPELIMKQVTSRDNFGQNDFFLVVLNPNNDAQNDTELVVFPTGTQADAIANPSNGEDFGWNAVWDSAVKIVDDGWIVEMKIPYAVLRFSNQEEPTWGLQFHRQFRQTREQYTWNPLDITKGNIGLYHGELKGLKDIEPPTRLSFYPFASTLINTFDGKTTDDYSLGLDVKYGISENFTLDMTLIPDFSQAGFDNRTLNLGPFEQTFSEQRQFFTEGVDLFSKGNLFFSRRVGNRPSGDVTLNTNEEVTNFPNTVKVLNAAKVSGRTKKGLGIGVFNAITEKTNAIIRDSITGAVREEVVEPLSNYNIIVLDQQFNGNSSISLINTNVTRSGHFRDANVTGLLADITNKKNTYNIEGQVKMSNVNNLDGNTTGLSTFFVARKVHGNFRYSFDHSYADTKYNINDLGLQYRNNFNNFGVDASYRTFEPTKKLNNYYIGTYINYTRLADPGEYTGSSFGFNYNAQTKTLHNFGGNINHQPGKQFDYFEPRAEGRYFIYENRINSNLWVSTNYNKTFAFDANLGGATYFEKNRNTNEYWFGVSPRVRFSDKLLISYSFDYNMIYNDRGYTDTQGNDIIFGERDQKTIVNSISGNYNFNSFHALSLTFRNYWSTVMYDNELFTLQDNGRLTKDTGYTVNDIEDPNVNFNTWNLDFSYSWQFAPGSQLSALYRNQLFNFSNASSDDYFDSLSDLFEQPIQHTFSLRLVYFIDYNNIKNVFNKKSS